MHKETQQILDLQYTMKLHEEAGKVILGDPKKFKKVEEIHNIIVFGQYIEVDPEEKEKLGLRRAAELYFTLNDEQRMQFEIQY